MNKVKQMGLANEVLGDIFPIDPHAIVAGGAPRDWWFDMACRDIDVFFYRPDLGCTGDVKAVFESVGIKLDSISPTFVDDGDVSTPEGHSTYFLNPHILHVFESTIKGQQFQFIQMAEPTFTSVVPHFPLNMSRIWYKFGKITATDAFLSGIKYQSLIKLDELYADGNKYIKKIMGRFPDYKYYSSAQAFYEDKFGRLV